MATYDKEEKKVVLSSEDKKALSPTNKTFDSNKIVYWIINGNLKGYNPNQNYIQ